MREEGDPGWDIRERTLEYGLRAVRLHQALQEQDDRAGWTVARQFLRSATSVGANIAEAQAAESRADFVHKFALAQKEARESLYWLQLLQKSGIVAGQRLSGLIDETEELISVISSILISTKRGAGGRE